MFTSFVYQNHHIFLSITTVHSPAMNDACRHGDLHSVKLATWKSFQATRRHVKTPYYLKALRDFQRQMSSAMEDACVGGHLHVLKWLCADLARDSVRNTHSLYQTLHNCLHLATHHNHKEVVRWILDTYGSVLDMNHRQAP